MNEDELAECGKLRLPSSFLFYLYGCGKDPVHALFRAPRAGGAALGRGGPPPFRHAGTSRRAGRAAGEAAPAGRTTARVFLTVPSNSILRILGIPYASDVLLRSYQDAGPLEEGVYVVPKEITARIRRLLAEDQSYISKGI